jgi:hypothetical protein
MPDQYGINYDPDASGRSPATSDNGLPTRPYAAPDQLGGNAPRSAEFNTGINGDPGNAASSLALNADADRFNAMVPRQFEQHSVLQTAMPSANAMSATDYERVLPGSQPGQSVMLPTVNGSSQGSYDKSILMRLQGRHVQ